jgi:superoxide reductase
MMELANLFQEADWKKEKHVPAITGSEKIQRGAVAEIVISVGKEIVHPNTTEHHIRWLEAYFLPRGEKFPYQLGRFEFNAHGESIQGPNTSTVYANPEVAIKFKTDKSGTVIASSYCNIHGLWQSSKELTVE